MINVSILALAITAASIVALLSMVAALCALCYLRRQKRALFSKIDGSIKLKVARLNRDHTILGVVYDNHGLTAEPVVITVGALRFISRNGPEGPAAVHVSNRQAPFTISAYEASLLEDRLEQAEADYKSNVDAVKGSEY